MSTQTINQIDINHLAHIRQNIISFMRHVAATYVHSPARLLDIAPQVHEGAKPFFSSEVQIDTFDIDPDSGCTHIGDICTYNSFIADASYDFVVCTEVLEHTLQPFDAVNEIERILRSNGLLFLSVPFNFRIHGPLPDCWRFTEHGLRSILKNYEIIELNALDTPDRFLMPIQYTVVARKR